MTTGTQNIHKVLQVGVPTVLEVIVRSNATWLTTNCKSDKNDMKCIDMSGWVSTVVKGALCVIFVLTCYPYDLLFCCIWSCLLCVLMRKGRGMKMTSHCWEWTYPGMLEIEVLGGMQHPLKADVCNCIKKVYATIQINEKFVFFCALSPENLAVLHSHTKDSHTWPCCLCTRIFLTHR